MDRKAYIIGGGVAGMATAAYLISDGGMKGENMVIFERGSEAGGSFDGRGSAERGYICSGYRMFEETAYLATFDLLAKIPSLHDAKTTLKDEFFAFNRKLKVHAKARLMEKERIIDARRMGLKWRDRLKLVKLLYYPEWYFESVDIKSYFTPEFFKTNFWFEWATTFAFEQWHSILELKRYLCRCVQDAPMLDSMKCVLSAPYCEHDFIILPLMKWLKENGVRFRQDCRATDLEFALKDGKKNVTAIMLEDGRPEKIQVNRDDLVFITNGSMTADAGMGSMDHAPKPAAGKTASWDLWKNIAGKCGNLGNPQVFCGSPEKTAWESFTITFHDAKFFKLVEKLTGNKAGTGGLITFKDSNWLMTIGLPPQPYFINQPENTYVCWGYGLLPGKNGNYVKKKMADCSGREILEELLFHLGFGEESGEIIKKAACIPCLMPYIGSQFMPRKKEDRPAVVPKGAQNFAFIGQYVEIPREIIFTVECSIRSAKIAVKKLLNLPVKIPPIRQKKYSLKALYNGIKTTLR